MYIITFRRNRIFFCLLGFGFWCNIIQIQGPVQRISAVKIILDCNFIGFIGNRCDHQILPVTNGPELAIWLTIAVATYPAILAIWCFGNKVFGLVLAKAQLPLAVGIKDRIVVFNIISIEVWATFKIVSAFTTI